MGTFLGIIGMLGFIFSLVFLVVVAIKKKPKKKVGIALGVFFIMFILGIALTPTKNSKAVDPALEPVSASSVSQVAESVEETASPAEKVVLSVSDKELLKKAYTDFDVNQRLQFTEIGNKYSDLADDEKQEVKVDFERLTQEKDIQLAKEAEEAAAKEAEEAAAKEAEEAAKKAKEAEEAAIAEAQKYDTGITYEQLARTPDDYIYKYVKFTGTVLQTIEGDGETDLRIAINGNYDQVIFAAYDSNITSIRILENDTVTIKGTSAGIYTYESTLGGNISVPAVLVSEIELN